MGVSVCVATMHHASSLITDRPTAHWVGPETLVGLQVEGREADALANSGSQVNIVTPCYVHQHKFPVLPLCDLVDHPLNLVGLGGMRTHPLGFVILRVQVNEITGYDKDVVFLVVPDESEFSWHIPIMIGTCTLGRIINVIKESEVDRLLTTCVRSNLAMHLSDTHFAIWQPIQRPRLLERVYKPIHTPHWCGVLPLRALEIGCK